MTWPSATEIRMALRSLARSPAVTISAIVCLALGIGATTAISSALSRALLQPLPFRDPERLVSVHRITPQSGPTGGWSQSAANYVDLRDRSKQISDLAAITWGSAVINLPDDAIQASLHYSTANLFQMLGAQPQMGRFYTAQEDAPDAPRVAVMSDDLWRSRFGGDASVVGRTLTINGEPTVIVGVGMPDFRVPVGTQLFRADLWMPIRFTPDQLASRGNNYLNTLGRLAPSATVESAEAELRGVFAGVVREHPFLQGDNVRVAPLHAESVKGVRRPLLLLFGAVCLVLLIAATNVAALFLARGVRQQRDTAVRAAIGASQWDIVRQPLLESFIVSAVSVVLGIVIAAAGVKTIGLLAAARLPQLNGLSLDMGVLGFALVLSIVVALVCGAAPAWRSVKVDPQDALRGGRGGGAGRAQHRALRSLVVLEITMSLVLLIAAGLVLKGFAQLIALDPGFDAGRILTLRVTSSAARYPNNTGARNFVEPVVDAIARVPGVEAASPISAVPYISWGNNSGTRYEGVPDDNATRLPIVEVRGVTPGFFDVTKQRLVAGRLLRATDDENAPNVVVVNEALVKRDFAGRDPIGKRFHISDTEFATIVGVLTNIRNAGPINEPAPERYVNYAQFDPGAVSVSLMIRVRDGDPTAVMPAVRAAVRGVDPTAAIAGVASMTEVITRALGSPRFYLAMLGSFAALAIVLAVAGLYGVLSYAVAQRTREVGIRSALGSSPGGVVRLFAKEGFRLVLAGVGLGLVGSLAVTRVMGFMLYGVSPLDARTWALAVIAMVGASMVAVMLPARRAAKVAPLIAMRAE
jgi:putative ABC transport system permease protein